MEKKDTATAARAPDEIKDAGAATETEDTLETKYPPKESCPVKEEGATQAKEATPPGFRLASVLFFTFGGVFFWQSLLLFKKDPTLTGYASFPLLVSSLLLLLTIVDLIGKFKVKSATAGLPFKERVIKTLKYALPADTLILLGMSVVYYVLLLLGVGFLISSAIFLMGSMCYMIPKSIVKNAIFTVILLAAIYLIFTVLFRVSLP